MMNQLCGSGTSGPAHRNFIVYFLNFPNDKISFNFTALHISGLKLFRWKIISTSALISRWTLRPPVPPAVNIRGICSWRSLAVAVWVCACVFLKGHTCVSAFLWGDKHCGAAMVGFLQDISPALKGRSLCLLFLHGAEKCTWNVSMVVNQNTLRGGSVVQVTPQAKHWELCTLICGRKMSRTIFVRWPWLCEGLGHHSMMPEVEARDGSVRKLGFSLLLVGPSLEGDQDLPCDGHSAHL